MSRRALISGFCVAASLMLGSCGQEMLNGLKSFNASMERVNGTGRFWYQSNPGFKEVVAPYITDSDQFSAFMNKYKEPRLLSEDERLQVIVQLGIYQFAPDWLKPGVKSKIDRMRMRNSTSGQRTGSLIPECRFAAAEIVDPLSGGVVLSDAPQPTIQLAATLSPTIIFDVIVLSGITYQTIKNNHGFDTIANIDMSIPIGQIYDDLKTDVVQKLKASEHDFCARFQCQTISIPKPASQDQSTSEVLTGTGNCTPDEHKPLQDRVENACGAASKCVAGDTVTVINQKIGQISSCLDARRSIMNRCYAGGDVFHERAWNERMSSLRTCQSKLLNARP